MVLGIRRYNSVSARPVVFDVVIPSELKLNKPPSLVMDINPQNLKQEFTKVKNLYQTLEGWVEEHYGDELDTISCDASSAGFYTPKAGLTHIDRKSSQAYRNFKDVLDLYSNNGKTYDKRGIPIYDGNIQITFDGGIYLGLFETFTYDDIAENPYRMTFSFNFKVEETIYRMGF